MAKIGARAPRTRYIGRDLNFDLQGNVDSGIVRTLCSFLTASGFERELEIPVLIYEGEILEPSVAMVNGNPVILSKDLVGSISDAGTILEKPPLGTMYSTAYAGDPGMYRELRDSIRYQPRVYRPLY